MPTPRSLLAINAVKARLANILKTNGYNTDAGRYVFHGPIHLDDDKLPALIVGSSNEVVQQDTTGRSTGNGASSIVAVLLDITIAGFVKADATEEKGVELELLQADIEKAVFVTAASVSGRPVGLPAMLDADNGIGPLQYLRADKGARKDGQEFESVVLTCAVTFNKRYGDPYAAK